MSGRDNNMYGAQKNMRQLGVWLRLSPQCWGHSCCLECNTACQGEGSCRKEESMLIMLLFGLVPVSSSLGPQPMDQPEFDHFSLSFCTSFLGVTSLANSVHVASHLKTCSKQLKRAGNANLAEKSLPGSSS